MDADRFDTLARFLSDARSRRRGLASVLGGLVTLGALPADAKRRKKKPCPPCKKRKKGKCKKKLPDGAACAGGTCQGGSCVAVASPCTNGLQDGSETDIDCGGGTCRRCSITQTCLTRNDCASALCAGTPTTCQPCVNAGDCGNDADEVTPCACRDHESGQRFCTKNGTGDVRLLPAGTACTACEGGEQCFPINGGADGIECIRPCGAS